MERSRGGEERSRGGEGGDEEEGGEKMRARAGEEGTGDEER